MPNSRRDVAAKLSGIFAHREMTGLLHGGDAGGADVMRFKQAFSLQCRHWHGTEQTLPIGLSMARTSGHRKARLAGIHRTFGGHRPLRALSRSSRSAPLQGARQLAQIPEQT